MTGVDGPPPFDRPFDGIDTDDEPLSDRETELVERSEAIAEARTTAEIRDRIDKLRDREREFENAYGVDGPGGIDTYDRPGLRVKDVWRDACNWSTVIKDRLVHERALDLVNCR